MLFNYFAILMGCIIQVISAPIDDPVLSYNKGDIVGVRAEFYQHGAAKGAIPPHPGVVLGDQKANGNYDIAIMSKKLPFEPPQHDIKAFHPDGTLYGNIALSPPYDIQPKVMKPWKSKVTGVTEIPMSHEGVEKLKEAMIPHAGWKAPEPASGDEAPAPKPRKRKPKKAKGDQADASVNFAGGSSSVSASTPQRKLRSSAMNKSAKPVPKGKKSALMPHTGPASRSHAWPVRNHATKALHPHVPPKAHTATIHSKIHSYGSSIGRAAPLKKKSTESKPKGPVQRVQGKRRH